MPEEIPKLRTHGYLLDRDIAYSYLPLAHQHCISLSLCDQNLSSQQAVITRRNGRWPKNVPPPPLVSRLLLPLREETELEFALNWLEQHLFGRHIMVTGCLVQPHNVYLQVHAPQFIVGFDHYNEQERLLALPVQHERVPSLLLESVSLAPTDPEFLRTNKQVFLFCSAPDFEVVPESCTFTPAVSRLNLPLIQQAVLRKIDLRTKVQATVLDLKQRFQLTLPTQLAHHSGFEHLPANSYTPRQTAQNKLIQACHTCSTTKYPQLLKEPNNNLAAQAEQQRQQISQERVASFMARQLEDNTKKLRAHRLLQAQSEINKSKKLGIKPPAQAVKIVTAWHSVFDARKQAQQQASMDFNASMEVEPTDPNPTEHTKG